MSTKDCIQGLQDFKFAKEKPKLIIADSPYNLNMKYDKYDDSRTDSVFVGWCTRWLLAAVDALADDGTLWMFMSDGYAADLDVICRRQLGLIRRSWVIWHYTFGVNQTRNFTPSHTHIFYYTKSAKNFTFNADSPALRVPSARQLKYNDKRANGKGRLPDNTWVLFPEQLPEAFNPTGNTWLFSRVCGTYHERREHSSNQLPLALVERIVRSTSNPGDLVVDPFLGTGTSGVAAVKHGRMFIGFDHSARCVKESRARIKLAE